MDIDTKVIFSKTLTFIYVEMPKFSKAESELKTLLDKWLYAIKTMAETDNDRPVSLTGEAFDQFFEQARYACLDEDEQRIYDRSLMDYWDIYAIEQTHFNDGLEKGKALGALQMLISLVRKGLLSLHDAAVQGGMSEADFKAAIDK